MIMILKIVISAVAYLILAPFAGGLLTGMGRRFSSGLQAKRGASMMQPFRDVKKLREKTSEEDRYLHDYYVRAFVFFEIVAGVAFFRSKSAVCDFSTACCRCVPGSGCLCIQFSACAYGCRL